MNPSFSRDSAPYRSDVKEDEGSVKGGAAHYLGGVADLHLLYREVGEAEFGRTLATHLEVNLRVPDELDALSSQLCLT